MDPVAALLVVTDTARDLHDRAEFAGALLSGLDRGSFAPVPDVDAIRAALADLRERNERDLPLDPDLRDEHRADVATCLAALLAVVVHRPADDGSVW